VITPVGSTRQLLLGEVTGAYRHGAESVAPVAGYGHVRPVRWIRSESGHLLPPALRHQLTSPLVIHRPAGQRTLARLVAEGRAAAADLALDVGAGHPDPLAETRMRSMELVKDVLARLPVEALGEVVIAVLGALGLVAFVADPRSDAGEELEASERPLRSDGGVRVLLRAEPGRLFTVEDLDGFAVTLTGSERGVVVATGGFVGPCRDAAAGQGIDLIDVTRLAELVVREYERLDDRARQLVPLTPVLFPVV
jgi:restriction system protein